MAIAQLGILPANWITGAGYTAEFYEPGTGTPKSVYTDDTAGTAIGSTVTFAASGLIDANGGMFWMKGKYRIIGKDAAGSTVWDEDNIETIPSYNNDGWIDFGDTPTFITYSAPTLTFTVPGDETTNYAVGRRLKAVGTTPFTKYGTIATSAYTTLTTVTVSMDSGTPDSSLSQILLSISLDHNINFTNVIYPVQSSESAVTVSNPEYPFGHVHRYGAVGDDSTDDTTAIAAAITAVGAGGTVIFKDDYIYSVSTLTISNNNTTFATENGGMAKLHWPTLGASTNAISVEANEFTIRNMSLQGPAGAVYVGGETCISMQGTSSASRKTGLYLHNVEIYNFGYDGVNVKWTDHIRVDEGCYFHDIGYHGFLALSCDDGRILASKFKTFAPGTGGNMYGISLSHDSSGYSGDGNAGTKQALNPFCSDWVINGNHVEDSAWNGIDCHGGYEVRITNNNIYNCQKGLSCSSSSGDAVNYAGWSNIISGNVLDAANPDGTASSRENSSYGINVNGGATVAGLRVVISQNIINNYGIVDNANSGSIQCATTKGAVIQGNVIDNWGGNGIVLTSSEAPVVDSNIFLELASSIDTVGRAIYAATATTYGHHIVNNVVNANGGTAAKEGYRWTTATARSYLSNNNFSEAATPYVLASSGFSKGNDLPNVIPYTNDDTTPSVSGLTPGLIGTITLNYGVGITITNFDDAQTGQIIVVRNIGTNSVTVSVANAKLPGAGSWVGGQYDTLTLQYDGTFWIQLAESDNS